MSEEQEKYEVKSRLHPSKQMSDDLNQVVQDVLILTVAEVLMAVRGMPDDIEYFMRIARDFYGTIVARNHLKMHEKVNELIEKHGIKQSTGA